MPEVDVVIPIYRESTDQLARALDSVAAQHVRTNPIVIDSSEQARGSSVAEKFDAAYLWREPNGPGAARNAGIAAGDADWVAFLDSDDIWLQASLGPRIERARRHDTAIVWSDQGISHSGSLADWQPQTATDAASPVEYQVDAKAQGIPSRTVVVRRETLPERPFCSDLAAREDPHLWTRLLAEHEGVRFPTVTAVKDAASPGLSDDPEQVYQAELESIARLAAELPNIQQHRPEREAIAAWRYARRCVQAGLVDRARDALADCREVVPAHQWRAVWALTYLPGGYKRAYRALDRAQEVVS